MNPINDTKNIIVRTKKYFFIIFSALLPSNRHKIASDKNLKPLDAKLKIIKTGNEIPLTPEAIAAIL